MGKPSQKAKAGILVCVKSAIDARGFHSCHLYTAKGAKDFYTAVSVDKNEHLLLLGHVPVVTTINRYNNDGDYIKVTVTTYWLEFLRLKTITKVYIPCRQYRLFPMYENALRRLVKYVDKHNIEKSTESPCGPSK